MMNFQTRLYELRRRAGLSQEGLADLLGVTRQAVQKWEAGASRPDMDNLCALAKYFSVSLDWLVTGAEPEQAPPGRAAERRREYEYRSRARLFGLPLVHIHIGEGMCCARGVVAIGNVAAGAVAVGGMALGAVSLGGLSAGLLLGAGGLAAGTCAVGGLAVGALAWGGVSLGWLAVGGVSMGTYAAGGVALGREIAVGRVAAAALAIGEQAEGLQAIPLDGSVPLARIHQAIRQSCAGAPGWLAELLCFLAGR